MSATSITKDDVRRAIQAIETCEQQVAAAVDSACNETYAQRNTTMVGGFADGTCGAATRANDAKCGIINNLVQFREGIANADKTLWSVDDDAARRVNTVDPSGGAMPNFARLA